ncbi:E3 ubiquitin-protein ligase TRIM39-like [Dromiciops gliroides]|uniref:E3 ubiquitin-protein ligase TRIM39-like n=1 Tax=Dromiciops gliroides TaxID=33562 RepID=UPI001CC5ACED|nr:E3 ubiquitin-protein ligase TRIM39-like [Dromiciops gliroides]
MASYLISNVLEELKCSICLNFITSAVSIKCGHSFCIRCIRELMTKTTKFRFQCPKCNKKCMKNLQPNRNLGTVAQYFELLKHHMMRNWKLRDVIKRKFQEDIILDPETAYEGISLSTDRKTMRRRNSQSNPHHTGKTPDLCGTVLATQSFTSGRHYWEVTVGKSCAWDVGLCNSSASRVGEVSPSSAIGHWLLSLRQNKYFVCTMPRMCIALKGKLLKVGIFLDYEAGDIVFYDVENSCQIYIFTSSFSEPLWPIFSIFSKNKNILTIEPVSNEAEEIPEQAEPLS